MSQVDQGIHIPESLKIEAVRLAEKDGVSLDEWIAVTVAQKIGVVEEVYEFFRRQAQDAATVEEALAILDKAPKVPPMPLDDLPEGWTPLRKIIRESTLKNTSKFACQAPFQLK